MEASLWGRLESATILLSRGADRDLYDKKSQRALDLTHPTHRNRKERHTVAGGIWGDPSKDPIYKEAVLNRDSDRREIARVLREIARVLRGGEKIPGCCRPGKGPAFSFYSGDEWLGAFGMAFNQTAIVGHTLSVHAAKDQGIQGQFQASHAEKQLIAYFLDRHVFLRQDKTLNPQFDEEIESQKSEISEMASRFPSIRQMYRLQEDRKKLVFELFDKDDKLLGDEYDEELVKGLKSKVASLDEEIAVLKHRPETRQMRARERQIRLIERQKTLQERLNRMSAKEPNKVNNFFGLQIELLAPQIYLTAFQERFDKDVYERWANQLRLSSFEWDSLGATLGIGF
ncbi:hypothetical protein N7536_012606 [Penicillium majusculum]|nr:hypothetical protein N7536_012606 [Penicillium majusculum]